MWVLAILTLIAIAAVFMLPPIPQSLSYHHFADTRTIWGIPNFANTISNFPFLLTGMAGLYLLNRAKGPGIFKVIYALLFIGIILTGFGSAFYHYYPDNQTLIYDRIPMTIVFMSLLAANLSEQIDLKWGSRLLLPLILVGIASILWWHYTESIGKGDLRLYGLVQFYPVVFIPLILLLFPSARYDRGSRQFIWVALWYIIAKGCEHYDGPIYAFTGFISGHSVKHLAAATSTWFLVQLFRKKHILQPPSPH